jgi:hypothetical protein
MALLMSDHLLLLSGWASLFPMLVKSAEVCCSLALGSCLPWLVHVPCLWNCRLALLAILVRCKSGSVSSKC